MAAGIDIPENGWYVLANARVPVALAPALAGSDGDGLAAADIAVADGKITGVAARGERPAPPRSIDLAGRIVLPPSSIATPISTRATSGRASPIPTAPSWARSTPRAPTASPAGRPRNIAGAWISPCVGHAHGTRAIHTHLDSIPPQDEISWPVFTEMRERWKGRIELQAACLFGIEQARDEAWLRTLVKRVAAAAGGVLGAVACVVPGLDELLLAVSAPR